MYYSNPNGNNIEMQVDNFDTPDEVNDFMSSKYFAENPIGTDFDPEEIISKVQAGESLGALKKRIEIGLRGLPISEGSLDTVMDDVSDKNLVFCCAELADNKYTLVLETTATEHKMTNQE